MFKLFQKEMFIAHFKKIGQNFYLGSADTHIYMVFSFENPQKPGSKDQVGAPFMVSGLDLTIYDHPNSSNSI